MGRLNTLQAQVEKMLRKYPTARDDDRFLITAIYVEMYHVNPYAPFTDVILRHDLPPFESIRRTRQKAQQENEDLRGNRHIEKIRMELQPEYIAYARGEEA